MRECRFSQSPFGCTSPAWNNHFVNTFFGLRRSLPWAIAGSLRTGECSAGCPLLTLTARVDSEGRPLLLVVLCGLETNLSRPWYRRPSFPAPGDPELFLKEYKFQFASVWAALARRSAKGGFACRWVRAMTAPGRHDTLSRQNDLDGRSYGNPRLL